MTDVTITVRGEHERRVAAEQAVVTLRVAVEGPDRSEVVARLESVAAPLTDALAARRGRAGLVEWTSDRMAVWSERPWGDGHRLAPVHHASVDLTATFDDPAPLSAWVTAVADRDEVEITNVEWRLTPVTRAAVERDVASEAVGVAVDRATAYAAALGRGTLTPLEVADVGLLSTPGEPGPGPGARMMRASFSGDAETSPQLRLQPDDIVVSAAVEARFNAR
ncbi:SIMPL domain-containing protein [Microbacterium sp. zg-Y818]|uniref:SIMPL domain-containing protein n=1 Tax=unclassified Microbacterium TaxID=2609290 RepID=UPI00214B9FD6|nr:MULTISPECIES: SIMPL domain-containing protein [unclassified Microbacterium]MCR2801182.1 SIMPL domain-containing protein [Microbacterium sp. zg.Y818]WIM21018.1 SIMPL domain-containing protein [Microbacterium sp. zg-Y818]